MIATHPAARALARRHRVRIWEAIPWALALGFYVAFPKHLGFGTELLITILFAISLDLVLGYAGIVTLGHAAFFGAGAYAAGIFALRVWGEPLAGLAVGGAAAAVLAFASGAVLLRSRRLTLIMLTLATVLIVQEAANKMTWLTGGADGLQGISMAPVAGAFAFDLFGRVSYELLAGYWPSAEDAAAEAAIMMPLSLALAERCDAFLRIGGPSVGADQEMARFHAAGADMADDRVLLAT